MVPGQPDRDGDHALRWFHWRLRSCPDEIGRASGRERVEISVVAVTLKKKKKWCGGDGMAIGVLRDT